MSWKPEVQTDNTGEWYSNALCFATRAEAEANVDNIAMRWSAVIDTRVVESDDPVNYQWINGKLVSFETVLPQENSNELETKEGE